MVAAARLRQRAPLPGRLRRRRRAPGRPQRARRPGQAPVHHEGRPARELPVRHVRGAPRTRSCGSTPRRARPASPPSSATPATTSTSGPPWWRAASGPPADGPATSLHVAYGYGLFTGGLGAHYGAEKLGCTVVPVSGGMTERQVQLIRDFQPDIIMVTPSYMLAIIDEMERQGIDPRATSLQGRHLRRRAVDQRHAPRDGAAPGHARRRHLRALRGDRPRRGQRVRGDQGRPARLGGPLLPGDHRPGSPGRCCRTARRASSSSPR